jgi:hypothetical protein
MFFNLDTGDTYSTGKGTECWMADGNLWFSSCGIEASVNQIPLQMFCDFLDQGVQTNEYIDMDVDGFFFALEDTDEGFRNLTFSGGAIFLNFNIQAKHLPAFSKFLRAHIMMIGESLNSVELD